MGKKFNEYGLKGLKNKVKSGSPLSKYQNKKNLTKEGKLEYENMKLRIENEMLKKRFSNERRWYICKIHEITQIKNL